MEQGSNFYQLSSFNDVDSDVVKFLYFYTNNGDDYILALGTKSVDGSYESLIDFFTYDYTTSSIKSYNDDIVKLFNNSILVDFDYEFLKILSIDVFCQGIFIKEI